VKKKKELLESMLRTCKVFAQELAEEESGKRFAHEFNMVSNKVDIALDYLKVTNKEEVVAPKPVEGIATC
jgi:hypothetical protein